MSAPWQLAAAEESVVTQLADSLQLHPALARVLVLRGVSTLEEGRRYLDPRLAHLTPPTGMAALDQATTRLLEARERDELVGVFGDYDVDGVTSAALVGDYLGGAGFRTEVRVARRDEGYGFGVCQAQEFAERGVRVLVVCDCGTSDLEAVGWLAANGLDVIVLDHHRVPEDQPWPGFALVNPQRSDDVFPFKGLCSGGLAFYAMAALRRKLVAKGYEAPDPRGTLDLVALATVADVAPMTADNRILVARGLETIGASKRPGLIELLRLAELEGKTPSATDVGWRLGPRLNAPGRLGDADVALQCLAQRDPALAVASARRCDALNTERKEIQARILEEAIAQAEAQPGRSFVLVAGDDWHPGVVGIVAGRLVERFARPAAVVAFAGESGRASARSVPGVDLFALLQRCAPLLQRFGGHSAAAGFSVARELLEGLREALEQHCAPLLAEHADPHLAIDAELALADVGFGLCDDIARIGPYGADNPEPVFVTRGLRVDWADVVGRDHLRLGVSAAGARATGIGFGMAAVRPAIGARVDLAFTPMIDVFREPRVRLRLVALREVAEAVPARGGR